MFPSLAPPPPPPPPPPRPPPPPGPRRPPEDPRLLVRPWDGPCMQATCSFIELPPRCWRRSWRRPVTLLFTTSTRRRKHGCAHCRLCLPCASVRRAQREDSQREQEAVAAARQARQDQEGTLFLTKRRSHPRFQLIILNKKSGSACGTRTRGGSAAPHLHQRVFCGNHS